MTDYSRDTLEGSPAAPKHPLTSHFDWEYRVTDKGARMLHIAVVDHGLTEPDALERALGRSKRLAAVARAACQLLENEGPCPDLDDDDSGHGEGIDCDYCLLNRAASALENGDEDE